MFTMFRPIQQPLRHLMERSSLNVKMNLNIQQMNYSSLISFNTSKLIQSNIIKNAISRSMDVLPIATGKLNNLIAVRCLNRNARRPKKVGDYFY